MTPMTTTVQALLESLHERWVALVGGLPDEALNWQPDVAETNSVAQLVRHTTAVQNYLLSRAVGDEWAHDHEHSLRTDATTQAELLELLHDANTRKNDLLARTDALDMSETFTNRRGMPVSRGWFVAHNADHGGEHLGHAELTAQLWRAQRA